MNWIIHLFENIWMLAGRNDWVLLAYGLAALLSLMISVFNYGYRRGKADGLEQSQIFNIHMPHNGEQLTMMLDQTEPAAKVRV